MSTGRFQIIRCGMTGVEAVIADSTHKFGRHTHDQFGIGMILRGAQKSLSGRGIVEAEAGDVITVNPGEVHDGSPVGDVGRAWKMLYFDPEALAEPIHILSDGKITMAELTHPALSDPAAATSFQSLFHAVTDPNGGNSEVETAEKLLILLERLIHQHSDERELNVSSAIKRARNRIDDDPASQLSLNELAAIGGVSQFQLIRGFSRLTGLTPHAYLVQRRLLRARRMIASGETLTNTAHASGFADQSHLTRLFVSAYGISPGRYAAAIR